MDELRLFRLAPEAMHLQATYVHGQGWHLTFGMRRQDEQWSGSYRCTYTHLTTDELVDVIGEELSTAFRLS